MKIYTGQGDCGETSLWGGEKVGKDSLRVAAYGSLDELNALLGAALSFSKNEEIRSSLVTLQQDLFRAGADLAAREGSKTGIGRIQESDWRRLERAIDELDSTTPPLKNFILPGGTSGAALLHLARTVCRRAERETTGLSRAEPGTNPELLIYLNRLSDLLFMMARHENLSGGGKEEIWPGRA